MTKKVKMKRINYAICGKYRKFKNGKIFKEKESIEILKVLGSIKNI